MLNKRIAVYIIACIYFLLLLTGCEALGLEKSTPIPERPVSEMSPQPPNGIAGAGSIGDLYIPHLGNTGYDVQSYSLDMEFSNQVDSITATVTITSSVILDNLGRMSLDFSGYQVDGVRVGESYAAYYRSPDKLYVDLPKRFSMGDELVVKISYHGEVSPRESRIVHAPMGLKNFVGKDLTYALAEPDGAHTWYPCNDHPLDKAAFRFVLTVPKGMTGIANGKLLQTIPMEEQDTFIWSETSPMASYLATVVVGKYQRIDNPAVRGVKIRHYVIEGDFDYSAELDSTGNILQYFSDLIGPYPFEEYGYVIVLSEYSDPPVAMETQTLVIIGREYMLDPGVEGLQAHEMAHMWFGDSVSLKSWGEIWLKEGLANYLGALWLDHLGSVDLQAMMEEWERVLTTAGYAENQPLNQPLVSDMYGTNTYIKGAWVYHMLSRAIGEANFPRFLQEYYQRFRNGNASTADMQLVAEQVSGVNLDSFFEQWVYGSGTPKMELTWTDQPGSVSVQICQTSNGQVHNIPLEIQLKAKDGRSEELAIQVDEMQEGAMVDVPFAVSELLADPGQKVLADISIEKVEALQGCEP